MNASLTTQLRRAALACLTAIATGAALASAPEARAAMPGDNGLIAFASSRDGAVAIYVTDPKAPIDPTTGEPPVTRLTFDNEINGEPAFSPDGSKIAFFRGRV